MNISMNTIKKVPRKYIYFFGSFGGILFGYDIGVMTGALPFLQLDWHMHSAFWEGCITSSLMFGAIFGGMLAGHLTDKIGRKRVLSFSALIFIAGSLLSALAPRNGYLYLSGVRVFLGLSVGMISATVPNYMSEMTPAKSRGRLSGINFTMIALGTLLSYVVDYFLQYLPATFAWRTMLGMAAVPALILFLGSLNLPGSPRYLVRNDRIDEARQVLQLVQPCAQAEKEIQDIQNIKNVEDQSKDQQKLSKMFTGKYRYLVIAGVGVAAFQQFMGVNAIFYYIPLIVAKATGHAASSNLMWPVIEGLILVLSSFIFLAIADKFNRRTLLIFGGTGMGLAFILPAVINTMFSHVNPLITIIFLCIYVGFYGFTWAPLTWVLVGEIFPLAIRGKAAGTASAFNWVGAFAVGLIFPLMTASMSQETVFAIFGVICLLAVAFVIFKVPETKGHTLEEIERRGVRESQK